MPEPPLRESLLSASTAPASSGSIGSAVPLEPPEELLARIRDLPRTERLALLQVDQVRRWRGGAELPLEAYCAGDASLRADEEAVLVLLFGEIVLREERGYRPRLEEYQARFPEYADRLILHRHALLALGLDASPAFPPTAAEPASAPRPGLPDVPGFEVLEEVGQGAMGVVYKARQLGLNRVVALKMLRGGAVDAQELARFRSEAEAVARLQHPGIVPIFQAGEHGGRAYFSMEYVEGASLAQRTAGTAQSPREAARLVEALARAMHYAHQQGIVHRDLKPANVLLAADDFPKICDFGLARSLEQDSSLTPTGAVVGTPSYMAPEQARGDTGQVGPAADIYALGAVLYELLTGHPPFLGDTPLDTLLQVVAEEPIPPRRLRTGVARDLETVCLKCLQKDAGKRYASAEALADDLRRFLAGDAVHARAVREWELAYQWLKKRRSCAGVVFLLLTFIGLIIMDSIAAITSLGRSASATFERVGETVGPPPGPKPPPPPAERTTPILLCFLASALATLGLFIRPRRWVLVSGGAAIAVAAALQGLLNAHQGVVGVLTPVLLGVVGAALVGTACRLIAWYLKSDVADTLLGALLGTCYAPCAGTCCMGCSVPFLPTFLGSADPTPLLTVVGFVCVPGAFLAGALIGAFRSPRRLEFQRLLKMRERRPL